MHNFTNDAHRGAACLSGVPQTECCHMVESNTADESCSERASMQTEMEGDGGAKAGRGMQKGENKRSR